MQVGISIAQSGPLSLMGMQALKGFRLWISRLQSEGGLLVGHKLQPAKLITSDDCGRTSLARHNTRTLIDKDRVDVLFGPYSSHLTKAASEISESHQKLLWNHGGASDEIFQAKPNWIVSTISPASRYLQKLPEWIARQDSSVERCLLLISSKGTFASDVAAGIREATDALTKPVRLHSGQLPEKAEEFLRLLNETSPQVLMLAGRFDEEIALLRTRPTWPKVIRYIVCVAAGVHEFYNALGHLSEGVIGPSQWEPGIRNAPAIGPTPDQFVRDFSESFGETPDYMAAGAFAAGLIAEDCIRRAASLEDARVRDIAHDLDIETFYGRFRIDSSGRQIGHKIQLVRWSGDRKIVIA